MKKYLISRLPEWMLCAIMGLAVTVTFCSGFDIELPGTGGSLLLLLCCAGLEALLQLCSRQRKTLIAGILLGCAAGICLFVYARTQHPLDDEAANAGLITGLILAVCQVLVHLLTRTRPGTVCLLLLGLLVCAFTQFLQFPAPALSYFLFFLAGVLMLLLRCYTVSIRQANMGSLHPGRLLLQAGALTAAAALLAALVYAAVILPLQPPTQELRLIQNLESMDLLKVLGVSSTRTVLDPNLRSDATPDTTEQDRDREETPEQSQEPQVSQEPPEATPRRDQEELEAPPQTQNISEESIRYEFPVKKTLLYVLCGVVLLLAAVLVLRLWLRRCWQEQVDRLSNEDAAANYFRFFLRRIRRAGIPKPETSTLQEYVRQNEFELSAYSTDTVTFGDLAAIYEQSLLGGAKVTDEELACFRAYYREFYRNLRQELGFRRYWLRFFLP